MQVCDFGRELGADQQKECLDELASAFGIRGDVREFVGVHPVALSHETIPYLLNEDYLVCEKTDGIRLMLFVFNGRLYFYDRKNKMYLTDFFFDTPYVFLFDGELYAEGEKHVYAMFDALIYDSKPRTHLDLNRRLWYCFEFERVVERGFVRRARNSTLKDFLIVGKQMYKSYAFLEVLKSIEGLGHENDGLVFTPVLEPYVLYSRSRILKWKPPHLNTVDFLMKKSTDPGAYNLYCTVTAHQMYVYERTHGHDCIVCFGKYIADSDASMDGMIGEFAFDYNAETVDFSDLTVEPGAWTLHRIRTDKNAPNNIKVVLDTIDSVNNSLSESDLEKHWKEMMDNYKQRALRNTK